MFQSGLNLFANDNKKLENSVILALFFCWQHFCQYSRDNLIITKK